MLNTWSALYAMGRHLRQQRAFMDRFQSASLANTAVMLRGSSLAEVRPVLRSGRRVRRLVRQLTDDSLYQLRWPSYRRQQGQLGPLKLRTRHVLVLTETFFWAS